jgi:hypothetical protein
MGKVPPVLALLLVTSALLAVPAFATETINLRSGGGYALFTVDPAWQFTAGPPTAPLSASPFTAADFSSVFSGPNAVVVPPYGSFWLPSLTCDPNAQWISTSTTSGPNSALFGQVFGVHTCCIGKATLTFCWAADDYLGDPAGGGPNPSGVYLNGNPLAISGGNYATENTVTLDVTNLMHCGQNELHVYDRDGAATVSGALFSAFFAIDECALPTKPSTWGGLKATYR